jgi:hypothetical protein
MAQMLVNHDNPEISDMSCEALEEANKAANRNHHKIGGFCRKLEFQQA